MKKILCLALAGLVFASCNDDDNNDNNGNNNRVPISLSSRLTSDRERISRQDNQIAYGQEVSFFVTEAGVSNEIAYNNAMLLADGEGNFSITYGGEQNAVLYYPLYQAGSDFYAIHPYGNITLGGDYNFNIIPDQSNIENFLNSDLLYTKRGPVIPTTQPVQLVFEHKLAKINFVLIAGEGTSLDSLRSVEILNTQPQAILNTLNGALQAGTVTPTVNVNAYGLTDGYATVESGQASDISAIIVPQTFPVNQTLFRVNINGINYTYTPTAETVFDGGISYTYRLTLTTAGITVTSTITPWTPAEDQEGEGINE